LQAGQQVPELAEDDGQDLFTAETSTQWQEAGQQALEQVYAQQDEQTQYLATCLALFVDWFDAEAARQIVQASPDELDWLIEIGLLQQRERNNRYFPRWELIAAFLREQFSHMSVEQSTPLQAAYADHYAERASRYCTETSVQRRRYLFEQDIAHITQGQHLAATATPPLDQPLMIYADKCYWYFDQQRAYETLEAWTLAGLEAAKRQDDLAMQAEFCVSLGVAHERRGELDAAERYYREVYEGDLRSGADADTRARACVDLGTVHWQRGQFDAAERYYREVYEGDLRSGADADTRARACVGLGVAHEQRGQLDAAERYYREVYEGDLRSGADADTRAACRGLGNVHWQRGQFDAAERYYTQAILRVVLESEW
jgi:tetratricopeptide (TPR) repeat protein